MKFYQSIKQNPIIIFEIVTFAFAKLFIGLVQLPSYQKQQNYMIFLTFALLFYLTSLFLKLYTHRNHILKQILAINLRFFLIWIVSILNMVFSFSLCHALKWFLIQIIFTLLCQSFQTLIVVILCNWRYITKIQFVAFQFILCINILALGIKTVVFIELQTNSHNKDIVLLNLTTQIALAVFIMDALDRSYSRFCNNKKEAEKNKAELQLTMNT